MQILTNSHRDKLLLEWQKKHIWGEHADVGPIKDSVKQRLGVLGYGAIGRQSKHLSLRPQSIGINLSTAARISQAMGMDVIAYTASPRKTPESKKDHGYIVPSTGDPDGTIPTAWYSGLDKSSLHNFLNQDIDILLISVPLTPETAHFLGAEEFAILGKKNAFIVNIARGGIIQQDELIKALKKSEKEGGLRGAALDVTDPEPLGPDSELWDMENVAITPHVSGLGTTYAERSFQILEKNLGLIENGEDMINVIDRKKGY
jgi:phosphoglycerate dehydrogenase-like enzyme